MILNTEKWYNDNKKNMSKEEIDDAECFIKWGYSDRFYKSFCSCCGQYADATVEDVEDVDEETGLAVKLSYTCMPCFIKHKLPLSDEEFDKVKEELPECVKKEEDKYIKELDEKLHNTVEASKEFVKMLYSLEKNDT